MQPASGTLTGTLTYRERAELTDTARALVLIVGGAGTSQGAAVVASQLIDDPGQVPIAFSVPYANAGIDPNADYVVQAAIVDGDRVWITASGTPVITKGNATSGVDLTLTYRADTLKGSVTGSISGTGIGLGPEAFSVTLLVDRTKNTAVGFDVNTQPGQLPIPFAVPFDPALIDEATTYVVGAGIVDGPQRWENRTGVPVITNGNPLSGVTIPVDAPVSTAPSLITWLILLLAIGAPIVGVVAILRSRRQEEATEPAGPDDDGTSGEPAGPADDGSSGESPSGESPSGEEPPAGTTGA